MQHSAQNGSGRREERVPLETLIELRSEESQERLEADGINVSIGGVAMRASFVPPLGALLECRFHCPPGGELVCAQGEVMWSEWRGPHEGSFGVRFIELDTKSATTLRHYLAPRSASEAPIDRLRAATLVIDGLGASVEAELKLADETRIVLEQQLTFLQLGRGVEVSVLGRGNERGRIASVELRHTHFDVPTLVFGILLDEAPERPVEEVSARVAPLFSTKSPASKVAATKVPAPSAPTAPAPSAQPAAPMLAPARISARTTTLRGTPAPRIPTRLVERDSEVPTEVQDSEVATVVIPRDMVTSPEPQLHATVSGLRAVEAPKRPSQLPAEPLAKHAEEEEDDDDAYYDADEPLSEPSDGDADLVEDTEREPRALSLRMRSMSDQARAFAQALSARFAGLRQRIEPALREQAQSLDLPDARTRMLMHLARIRALMLRLWSRFDRRGARESAGPGRRARQPLRMQRSTLPGIGPNEEERSEATQRTRIAAACLAAAGIALGFYALAPRSGADRIRAPERVEATKSESLAKKLEPAPTGEVEDLDLAPQVTEEAALEVDVEPAPVLADPEPAARAAAPGEAPFGDAEVPNGRTFTLRMNGPVEAVEGERRENGFTVRIPSRLALDRASPIASSHNAVARAMILNRGGYAELTVDFLPGKKPRYQVVGKDNTLEITVERLGP